MKTHEDLQLVVKPQGETAVTTTLLEKCLEMFRCLLTCHKCPVLGCISCARNIDPESTAR